MGREGTVKPNTEKDNIILVEQLGGTTRTKHQSLIDKETIIKQILTNMANISRANKAHTKPVYKIEWARGIEPIENKEKNKISTDYRRLTFYVEETHKEEDGSNKIKKVILYEGVYFNEAKTILNPFKVLEKAYMDFLYQCITHLAYESYAKYLDNIQKQKHGINY